MRTVLTIALFGLLLSACGKNEGVCDNSDEFLEEVNNEQESLHYDDQYESHYIHYFLPGTIDSNYKGYICTEVFPDFLFTEGMTVEFSGRFYETDAYDDALTVLGGETISVLEIDFLTVH